jgi:predicted nucleic acid-binding protein
VVSEPLRPAPDVAVIDWLNRQEPQTLYLTAINLAELLSGIELLPVGRRRDALQHALNNQLPALFGGRVLMFDEAAAAAFARVNARAQAAGNAIGFADAAIAAIAMAHDFMVATRNVRDFQGSGVETINPWGHA